jgi:hypothetical protein
MTPHFKSAHVKPWVSAFYKTSDPIEVIDSQCFIRLFLIMTCKSALFMRGDVGRKLANPFAIWSV